jgi:hypothetical protein
MAANSFPFKLDTEGPEHEIAFAFSLMSDDVATLRTTLIACARFNVRGVLDCSFSALDLNFLTSGCQIACHKVVRIWYWRRPCWWWGRAETYVWVGFSTSRAFFVEKAHPLGEDGIAHFWLLISPVKPTVGLSFKTDNLIEILWLVPEKTTVINLSVPNHP